MGFDYVKKVRICEVGLRDGLQNEKTILTTDQKVELLRDMIDAGLKVIEVGSFVHPVKVPQMANTDEVVKVLKEEVPADAPEPCVVFAPIYPCTTDAESGYL